MQAPAQVQAAIELLTESIETCYPADRLMANYFRSRRYIGSKDKAAISELFYSVLRQRLKLEYLLENVGVELNSRHLVALEQHLSGLSLKSIFTGEKYQPKPLLAQQDIVAIQDEDLIGAPEHVRHAVPAWLHPELKSSLGEDLEAEMLAAQQRATTDIRVNTLQLEREELQASLAGQSAAFEHGALSPWAIKFSERVALFNLPEFKQGAFEVQDEGSQVLALLTNAQPGNVVVDFCAGAGGKSLALAAMMGNKGVLYACDVHGKRLAQLEKRARRAGVHNTRTHVLSSEHDKWVKKHRSKADVVLIDAPCSGTGTWRRNPDSRWNLKPEDLTSLQDVQASILQSASRLVKPGGRLIYATCSLLSSENEQQIERFLAQENEFDRFQFELPTSLVARAAGSEVRLLCSRDNTDGFFAACLRRKEKVDQPA